MSVETTTRDRSDLLALRKAFSLFPTGVVAVCALIDGEPVGIAVNSFTSVSLDPPLVGISVARTSTTWPRLSGSAGLGLSVLGADQGQLCRSLASKKDDRFGDAPRHVTDAGAVFLEGAALWLECTVRSVFEGGDHEVILLEVVSSELYPDVEPLVFHQSQFRALEAAI
ncbi:flavin reductase family protein [Salinibacterium sp. ZJ450]|uniref:flavin reductase family protein n=1 Tax=Salinibacterium sp. ZJ450 TaxID=2708338 RepID=UPI00141F23AC|nr:flavin reductase family protein [Salinibacterium sp. ZJ450]